MKQILIKANFEIDRAEKMLNSKKVGAYEKKPKSKIIDKHKGL